jgi:hypothetical protein
MQTFVFNTYGSRNIRFGIYSAAGSLIGSSVKTVQPSNIHKFISLPLQVPVALTASTEYWLGVWGDGIDLPAGSLFANLSATFPDGVHGVENNSATDLPATLSTTFPLGATIIVVPLGAYA